MPVVLRLEEACKAYGEKVLLSNASLALTNAMKVGVIGRNGAGKSTLVRILVGEEELDGGTLWRHRELRLAYLRQHDPWHAGESVADFLERDSGAPDWRCGQIAGRFEIKHERLTQPVSALSGGWQTRVKLSALLLHDPDFLVLDEPTNFLDLRTQMLLEDFLASWSGGCLLVSHDRDFLRATCDHTLAVDRGELELCPGPIDAYLAAAREKREHARR
ncbi:MAG: ATP-binding cassette domain-containing protein, partial [Planctomycetota bacterium]